MARDRRVAARKPGGAGAAWTGADYGLRFHYAGTAGLVDAAGPGRQPHFAAGLDFMRFIMKSQKPTSTKNGLAFRSTRIHWEEAS